ncbi:hypothetical protein NSA19_02920 [Actinomyces bowdenii]|uniref:hypothetical protein n=1 Tax=Actinomyces bowdenii TaxID=131109 RepID=UPI00214B095B|nr:hypothetical protein [Actinomyces bowdenii]MCR2051821.1 hypothetical protein [Actinomyces bowdenii]
MSKKKNRKHRGGRTLQPGATIIRAAEVGAVVPQDRAQKAEAAGALRTVTYQGYTWEMDPEDLNDYRIIDQANSGNVTPFLRALIPDEGIRQAILESLADEKGRIPFEAVMGLVQDLPERLGLGK